MKLSEKLSCEPLTEKHYFRKKRFFCPKMTLAREKLVFQISGRKATPSQNRHISTIPEKAAFAERGVEAGQPRASVSLGQDLTKSRKNELYDFCEYEI